jgi:hypothetical protein
MIAINKKFFITMGLTSLIVFGSLASMSQQQQQDEKPKNLKVLPKNISHDMLEKTMRQWSQALGQRCGFCHARGADGRNDFASDAKPEKLMARKMFEMTAKINKKYFKAEKDSLGMVMNSGIACITCHNGKPHPEGGMHHEEGAAEKK